MYIVLDTNIWVSQFALNKDIGSALRFFIREKGGTVVVPEVIKLEFERKMANNLTEWCSNIHENHKQLLSIFGTLKEINLPTKEEIEDKVNSIFSNLDIETRELDFNLDVARSSFLRTVNGTPPSAPKNQQFKDGVIWAHCMELLNQGDVYLVTGDKAFYENKDLSRGCEKTLVKEANKHTYTLTLLSEISDLLESIKEDFVFDHQILINQYLNENSMLLQTFLDKAEYSLLDAPRTCVTFYATLKSNELYSEFNLSWTCTDQSTRERPEGNLEVVGSGIFDTTNKMFKSISNNSLDLYYTDQNGPQKQGHHFINIEPITFGQRTIKNSIKKKIVELKSD